MKYILFSFIMVFLLINPNFFPQGNNREQIISEIENVIKPQYGEDYVVDIDFADSLIGTFSESGAYKFEDLNNLLNGCILFGAVKDQSAFSDSGIFGIYKDGMIKWHTDPIIKGLWTGELLIKDINKDNKIEIVTNWYIVEWVDAIWIFNWDGSTGSIINDYYDDPNSIDYGKSVLTGAFNSFEFIDYEDDGILELRCWQDTVLVTFSWNGDKYGLWANTPQVPEDYIFPANKLTVQCKAIVTINHNIFEYSYVWTNDSSSQQNIQGITLYNSSCNELIESPWRWLGDSGSNIVPLIGWTSLIYFEQMIHPGEAKDSFTVQCRKYPKIVDYYIQGYARPPSVRSPQEYLENTLNNSYHGYTIGPADTIEIFIPIDFLDTLLTYATRSFELGWITNQTTADKYDSLFTLAKTQLQQNNNNAAKTTLQTVLQEVDIDSTDNLTSEAYALLRYNTEYLIEKIPLQSLLALNIINPAMSLVNPGAFTMEVKGSGFSSSAVVYFNGNARSTTFVSDSVLNTQILSTDVSAAGNFPVWVSDGTTNSDTLIYKVVSTLPQPVRPVLECVTNNGDGTYTAFFGYKNENSVSVYIPVGSKNKFTPNPQDRGQTRVFKPGRQIKVYTVNFNGSNLVWTLNGRTSTASKNSAACQ